MTGDDSTTHFGLLRHASTEWNREKRIQGQRDSALTREGVTAAGRWGRRLKDYPWDAIIASDLGRAARTAALVNETLGVPVATDPGLREQDWGQWAGKTLAQLRREVPVMLSREEAAGWEFRPPGGETRNRVWERSSRALIDAAETRAGKHILVVTHEGVIKCLIYRLCGRRFVAPEAPILGDNHLHWLVCDGGELRVKEINALALP